MVALLVNNAMEGRWKESALPEFQLLTCHLSVGTEKNHESHLLGC
jgi:hypothetical protein